MRKVFLFTNLFAACLKKLIAETFLKYQFLKSRVENDIGEGRLINKCTLVVGEPGYLYLYSYSSVPVQNAMFLITLEELFVITN
jgi:hypothetical protein